jgi:hypothetical protein
VYKIIERTLRNLRKQLQQKDVTERDIEEIFENMT